MYIYIYIHTHTHTHTQIHTHTHSGLPGSSAGKQSVCNAIEPGLIPGVRKFP